MNGKINYSNRRTTKQNRNLTPISKNYNSNRIEINYPFKRNLTNINNSGKLEAACFLYYENKNYIITSNCYYHNIS